MAKKGNRGPLALGAAIGRVGEIRRGAEDAIAGAAREGERFLRREGERLLASANAAAENFSRNLAFAQGLDRQAVQVAAQNAPKLRTRDPVLQPATQSKKAVKFSHPTRPKGVRAGLERAAAVADGALDGATADIGDHLGAIAFASRFDGFGGSPIDRYRFWMAQSDIQESRDRILYPNSRKVGQVAGVVVPLVATGGASAAPQGFVRLAPLAAKVSGFGGRALAQRFLPQAAIGVAGGTESAATQVVTDIADPSRPVSVADTVGAFVGGAGGALATLYRGPSAGAGTEALMTELTRSALSGEPVSWEAIGDGAVVGSYAGRLAGQAGVEWSNGLPWRTFGARPKELSKEKLGDRMGEALSNLRLEGVASRQKYFEVSGGKTRADHVTDAMWPRENKFGFSASPSPRQLEALDELPEYRLYHFTPDDVGKAFGGIAGLLASQAASRPEAPAP